MVLQKLNKQERHKHHLQRALELDPDFYAAQRDYNQHYGHYGANKYEEGKENDKDHDIGNLNSEEKESEDNMMRNMNSNQSTMESAQSTTLSKYHSNDIYGQTVEFSFYAVFILCNICIYIYSLIECIGIDLMVKMNRSSKDSGDIS